MSGDQRIPLIEEMSSTRNIGIVKLLDWMKGGPATVGTHQCRVEQCSWCCLLVWSLNLHCLVFVCCSSGGSGFIIFQCCASFRSHHPLCVNRDCHFNIQPSLQGANVRLLSTCNPESSGHFFRFCLCLSHEGLMGQMCNGLTHRFVCGTATQYRSNAKLPRLHF